MHISGLPAYVCLTAIPLAILCEYVCTFANAYREFPDKYLDCAEDINEVLTVVVVFVVVVVVVDDIR